MDVNRAERCRSHSPAALQKDASLAFRSGAFLRAIEAWQWLVVDELDRADVDRAFGERMTVLGGRGTDTALVGEGGHLVRIGPDASCPGTRCASSTACCSPWPRGRGRRRPSAISPAMRADLYARLEAAALRAR